MSGEEKGKIREGIREEVKPGLSLGNEEESTRQARSRNSRPKEQHM